MFDTKRELCEKLEQRDLTIKQLNRRIEEYDRILNNITKAVIEFGYVELSDGKDTMRLVEAKP